MYGGDVWGVMIAWNYSFQNTLKHIIRICVFHYVVFTLTESNLVAKEMTLYMLSKCQDLGLVP